MKKIKKIFIPFAAVGLLVLVFLVLTYVNNEQKNLDCKKVEIVLNTQGAGNFIDEKDILKVIKKSCDTAGLEFRNVNLSKIEHDIRQMPEIQSAEAYRSVDGTLKVEAIQRLPIARIQNLNDETYYLDSKGELIPMSNRFTPRVPLVNGNVDEPYVLRKGFMDNDTIKKFSILDDVLSLLNYINKSEFWKAQIEQVYVNSDREFELIPKVGNHTILFGDTTQIEGKFKKLEVFYREGLNTDGWNDYKTINVKFKNQIICKR
jgi:cell division protein FtsQ